MKIMLDITCPRCGHTTSLHGLSDDMARTIAAMHICVDAVATTQCEPVERRVPGPGERLKDEEKNS